MNFRIRNLKSGNFFNTGLLETLANLTVVGEISETRFCEIFQLIDGNPYHRVFVAENDAGEVIGTATLLVEQELEGGLIAHIEDVATRKGFERMGIGSALVNHALSEAKKNGCHRAVLDCSSNNVPFYRKFGFDISGVQMRFDFKQVVSGHKPKSPVLRIFVDELSEGKTISVILEQKFIHSGGVVAHISGSMDSEKLAVRVSAINRALTEAMRFGCYKTILTCQENEVCFYEGIGFKRREISMSLNFDKKGGF